jgi:hypothetical protein
MVSSEWVDQGCRRVGSLGNKIKRRVANGNDGGEGGGATEDHKT